MQRCDWAQAVSDEYIAYHDNEWGVPCYDDRVLFEFLILEGAQAGLSWSTILAKREGYRKLFADFDPVKIAKFSDARLEKILTNPAIVRNRLKVYAARVNAKAYLETLKEFDCFSDYIWQFVGGKPIQNSWKTMQQVPVSTKESDAMSKDLKKRGFKFVGTTICYAYMQAVGMVNDHTVNCFRHKACRALATK